MFQRMFGFVGLAALLSVLFGCATTSVAKPRMMSANEAIGFAVQQGQCPTENVDVPTYAACMDALTKLRPQQREPLAQPQEGASHPPTGNPNEMAAFVMPDGSCGINPRRSFTFKHSEEDAIVYFGTDTDKVFFCRQGTRMTLERVELAPGSPKSKFAWVVPAGVPVTVQYLKHGTYLVVFKAYDPNGTLPAELYAEAKGTITLPDPYGRTHYQDVSALLRRKRR